MLRFTKINNFDKLELKEFEEKFDYDSPYVVDDSNFIPMSEAVRQLNSNGISQDIVNQYYDFPVGKDTGEEVPFSRTKECNDIAVLSSHISENTSKMADKISKSKAKAAERAAFEADLNAASAQISKASDAPKE